MNKKIHINNVIDEEELLQHANEFSYISSDDLIQSSPGKPQELFGKVYFKTIEKYEELISVDGSIHGFDGVFWKDGRFYIYESKRHYEESWANLINSAITTINAVNLTRYSNAMNMKTIAEFRFKASSSELDVIEEIIKKLKTHKKSLNIDKDRMMLCLGTKKQISLAKQLTIKSLDNFADTILIEYEKTHKSKGVKIEEK